MAEWFCVCHPEHDAIEVCPVWERDRLTRELEEARAHVRSLNEMWSRELAHDLTFLDELIDWGIADRLRTDRRFREEYIKSWAQDDIAAELRSMRRKRGLSQKDLAEMCDTGQSAISRSEQATYDGWTFNTLVRIAVALDARLRIILEPMERVVRAYDVVGTCDLGTLVSEAARAEANLAWTRLNVTESDRDRLRALLRECLPLAVWHETSLMEGHTVAPRAEHGWVPLSERLKAALEE